MLSDTAVQRGPAQGAPPADGAAGVTLVPDNLAAFAFRALSARAARETLDLQYYTWEQDLTGRLLAREVLDAADRGVRVRLLMDDLYVGESNQALATLARHAHVEVRLYNPFQIRSWGWMGDAVEFLFAGYRLNHRMHNKAWIVDGRTLIGGGRNIGDEYFDASSQFNFRDLDLVITGDAVAQANEIFQQYWDSPCVRPIADVAVPRPMPGGLPELRRMLDAAAAAPAAPAYLERLTGYPDLTALAERGRAMVPTGQVRIASDPPGKGLRRWRKRSMVGRVTEAIGQAQHDVLLISPYFVPGRRGVRLLLALAKRGVRLRVLTNSLAATDVLAVHGGYARYRRKLLRAGIELFELKRGGQEGQSLFGSGGASLHTKAFCIDEEAIFVGSFNLDPRSARLNTEMGSFVRDTALAGQLKAEFTRLAESPRSWNVKLEDGRLTWRDEPGGGHVSHREPGTTLWRRVLARVLGWLPLEPQL